MKRALALIICAAALAAATVALTQPSSVPVYGAKGPVQPIAFSHQIHAGKLGMDCLYCHSSAEKSAIARSSSVSRLRTAREVSLKTMAPSLAVRRELPRRSVRRR